MNLYFDLRVFRMCTSHALRSRKKCELIAILFNSISLIKWKSHLTAGLNWIGSNDWSVCGLISSLHRLALVATETERNMYCFRLFSGFHRNILINMKCIRLNSNNQGIASGMWWPILSIRIGTFYLHRGKKGQILSARTRINLQLCEKSFISSDSIAFGRLIQ